MHRAGGWWCMCVCRGREWEEAGKTQSDFSTPPSVFKECRMGPGGCSTGDHFAPPPPPLFQAGCLRTPSCFAGGRLAGLWGNMPVSRLQEHCAPSLALPDLHLLWGSPRGLVCGCVGTTTAQCPSIPPVHLCRKTGGR